MALCCLSSFKKKGAIKIMGLQELNDDKELQTSYKGLFRPLYAGEIDVMVNYCNEKEISFILHKNARTDMKILDETFGPFGWQRTHTVTALPDGRVSQICTVSIKNAETGEWIEKSDVGSESVLEAEKGQASDAFKRACTNWGIGRELYTCPELTCSRFKSGMETIHATQVEGEDGRYVTNDKFIVEYIGCDEYKRINFISIKDITTGRRVLVHDLRKPEEKVDSTQTNATGTIVNKTKVIKSEQFPEKLLADLKPEELVHEYTYASTPEQKKNCLVIALEDRSIEKVFNNFGIPVKSVVVE